MKYAGFWIRTLATLIDDVIMYIASTALTYFTLFVVFLILRPAPTFGEAFSGGMIQVIGIGASIAIAIPYYIVFHYKLGQTPGKMPFRIFVRDENTGGPLTLGQSTGRYFATMLSALPLGAGFLMAAWNPKKKALHDTLAGTISVIIDPRAFEKTVELPIEAAAERPRD